MPQAILAVYAKVWRDSAVTIKHDIKEREVICVGKICRVIYRVLLILCASFLRVVRKVILFVLLNDTKQPLKLILTSFLVSVKPLPRFIFLFSLLCLPLSLKADILGLYYDQNGVQRAYFTGNLITRVDPNINFSVGGGRPFGSFGRDDFSIRWIGELEVPVSGDYIFTTRSDDGVRLTFNNVLIIDNFTDHGPTNDSATVTGLVAGVRYPIFMEYYERSGGTIARLSWDGPGFRSQVVPASALFLDSTPPSLLSAVSPCLDGELILTFSEPVDQATAENLSNYSVDGGVVLTDATLDANGTSVRLSYFAGSANAFNVTVGNIADISGTVMTAPVTTTVSLEANGLQGTYFDQNGVQNAFFTGNQTIRRDLTVDFDVGNGSPIPGVIPNDDFSLIWQGEIEVPTDGNYTFFTVSDDGVRLRVDGNLIINNFTNHAATTDTSAPQALLAGQRYSIEMEYYERGGQSVARLEWQGPGFGRQVIQSSNLFFACGALPAAPVGQWQLDETNWNGTPGEVEDISGNALNGRAISSGGFPDNGTATPALTGNPGTCGYGDFNGTSDGFLQIDDPGTNSILDFPTELTMTTWIFPRSLPSSGLSTFVSKDENFEVHVTPSGQIQWWWGGGDRELTSTNTVALNAWNHIAITFAAGRQVIYINGATAGTRQSIAAITVNNDPLLIGTDLGILSRRFDGLIDEVRVYNTEFTAVEVNTVLNERHVCAVSPIDHYAISHGGSGVTCEAENITITARDAANALVNAGGRTIQVTATSSTAGWSAADASWALNTGTGTLTTPSDGVALYTFGSGETTVVLSLANTSEADIDIDIVDQGDAGLTDIEGSATDPILAFRDTALRFYNDANGDGDADGTDPIFSSLTSGNVSTPFVLSAIETNTETGACQARLLGAQDVELGYECVNPINCARSGDARVSGTPIAENDVGSISNFTTVSLTFDAEGETSLNLQYLDVGNIRLHARIVLAASGGEPALTLNGSSDVVTVRPADLVISAITDSGGTANPGSLLTGAGFVTGGESFNVTVESRNSLGGITPSFGAEIMAEGFELNLVGLVAPAGGQAPALNAPLNFIATAVPGRYLNSAVSWPEAGTITINATIADGDYLGTGDVNGTVSGNVGRFYPDHFFVNSQSIVPACVLGGFSYMSDQAFFYRPLDFAYSIAARGSDSTVLQNYDTSLGYPVDSLTGVAENTNNGTNLASRALVPTTDWEDGVNVITGTDNGGFARLLSGVNEVPDGPLTSVIFGLTPAGSAVDDVTFIASSLNMNATTAGDCTLAGDCNATQLGGVQNFRFGRLAGSNAHGPETAPLNVRLVAEYWDGTEFITNTQDSCTAIMAADISFDGNALSSDANRTVTLGGGSTTGAFVDFTPGAEVRTAAGEFGLSFSSPGINNTGTFQVDINLANYPWLRFDWDQDGSSADDTTLPSLDINFGRFRGHDRVIYWQEVLQ